MYKIFRQKKISHKQSKKKQHKNEIVLRYFLQKTTKNKMDEEKLQEKIDFFSKKCGELNNLEKVKRNISRHLKFCSVRKR